jgi:hypothetical protein
MDLQNVWFLCHASTSLGAIVYGITSFLPLPAITSLAYSLSLFSYAAANLIVLTKTYGTPRFLSDQQYWTTVTLDENSQYLLLAAVFGYLTPQHLTVLLPFAVYSFFHVGTFAKTSLKVEHDFFYKLKAQIANMEKQQSQVLVQMSLMEILNIPFLLFHLVVNRNLFSLLELIFYIQFIRYRLFLILFILDMLLV